MHPAAKPFPTANFSRRGPLPSGPPTFLLVEDNDLVALAYQRVLREHGAVVVVETVHAARAVILADRVTGMVTDIALPDGSGLELARAARERFGDLPILLISGGIDSRRLEVADEIGVPILLKPIGRPQLTRFAERAIGRQWRAGALLTAWVERYRLSAAEAIMLKLLLEGYKRNEVAAARGISPNTVRNQIGALLDKIGTTSVAETLAAFFEELAATP